VSNDDSRPAGADRQTWQADASGLVPGWLPSFWQPRILVKNGRFSPWFFWVSPGVWVEKSGAFNLLVWIAIGKDWIAECPDKYRRAIVAHECGHLSEFHWLIWTIAVLVGIRSAFMSSVVTTAVRWVTTLAGVWGGLGFAVGVLVLLGWGFVALLRWFEHRADDYAVRCVGYADTIGALTWTRNRMFAGKKAPWVEQRIRRLEAKAASLP